jgi:hypothetical protein
MHNGNCDPYIPALNQQLRQLYNKERFCVVDAIFGIASGGPSGPPDFIYDGVIMGEDIVSVDRIGLDILLENGMNHAWQASHIQTASLPPYNLGNYNLSSIDRINIINPSLAVNRQIEMEANSPLNIECSPNPFNQRVEIRFRLNKTVYVNVDIYNVEGRKIRALTEGVLQNGIHSYIWDGRDYRGMELACGVYLCKVNIAGEVHSARLLLLK